MSGEGTEIVYINGEERLRAPYGLSPSHITQLDAWARRGLDIRVTITRDGKEIEAARSEWGRMDWKDLEEPKRCK